MMLDSQPVPIAQEARYVELAREIAAGAYPLDVVLQHHNISPREWETIQRNPLFQRYMSIAIQEWNSITSTNQRIKMKMMLSIEHAMPELVRKLMGDDEPLTARAKLLELMMRGAEIGVAKNDGVSSSGSVQITINLGNDKQVSVEANLLKTVNPPEIEHDIEDLLA